MNLVSIIVNFETAEQQQFYEEKLHEMGIYVYENDDQDLWTEFEISGCTPDDISRIFNIVDTSWQELEEAK